MTGDGGPRVRPPVVAGLFYPDDPSALDAMVRADLAGADDRLWAGSATGAARPAPHAIVAPHAGFVYSGPIAASAYAHIASGRDTIERVVLLGPAHRVPVRGMAVPTVDGFATPLGVVPLDVAVLRQLAERPDVVADDRAHADEHSIEAHLPFLQVVLREEWSLVPIVVGRAAPDAVADVLDLLWGGPETLVVVSTDLSHFHDHATAQALDAVTAAAVVARRWRDVEPDRACGAHPLCGLLVEAERRDLPVQLLDLRNSGDTAGDRQRVVGYGAFAVG